MVYHGIPTRLIFTLKPMSYQRSLVRCMSQARKPHFVFPSDHLKAFEDDYTETPNYPPIDPETKQLSWWLKEKLQKTIDWKAGIQNSPTVEEKMMQLNVNRKYGWERWALTENFAYNCEPLYKFITRTHLVPDFILPDRYHDVELTKKAKDLVQELKEPLLDLLRFEFEGIDRNIYHNEESTQDEIDLEKTKSVVNQVNRILISVLADSAPHLKTCQVDHRPKIEAFWICGGMEPTAKMQEEVREEIKNCKELYNLKLTKKPDDPVDENFQYHGSSILQIRNVNPLENYVDKDSILCKRGDSIPLRFRHYVDSAYDLETDKKYATIRMGHWLGDDHRSSLLSIHPQNYLAQSKKDNEFWKADALSAINSQAILSSFGRMFAQAFQFGFDQFSDIDYPFSTQCISTNGFNWSFYAYQLNTIRLDDLSIKKTDRQNLCWGTKSMPILSKDGELNEEVVEHLVKFYLQPPSPIDKSKTSTGQVTPFISAKLSDLEPIKREYVFENVRDMFVHKFIAPECNPFPEIYDWERIYKIDHETRPMDARRRFFELPKDFPGSDPYNEPYPFRNPQKIPKALFRYRKILREKKEREAVMAAKEVEKSKYSTGGEEEDS